MAMKQRHTFHVEWVESLEARELLSGAAAGRLAAARSLAQLRAAHVATARAAQQQDRGNLIPQGPISVNFSTPATNGAVGTKPSRVVGQMTTHVAKAATPVVSVDASMPNAYRFNPKSGQITPAMVAAAGGYGGYKPGSYAMATPVGAGIVRTQSGSAAGLVNAGNLPSAPGPIVPSSPTTSPVTIDPTTGRLVDPASKLAGAAGATRAMIAPGDIAGMPEPAPYGMFDNATLSKADVAALKGAVDTFAGAYTYGADAAKDKAAGDALRSTFQDLALSVWSQTHVAPAASVARLDAAIADFAKGYTSGADLTKDKAAWRALNDGMSQFTRDLMASSTGTDKGLFDGNPGGPMLLTPPPVVGMGSGAIQWAADDLLNGPALTKDDVSTLQGMVDRFAAAYTSGADAAKDQATAETLRKDFSTLTQARWDRAYPPDAAGDPGVVALAASSNPVARKVTTQAPPVAVAGAITQIPRTTIDPLTAMRAVRGRV